MAIDPKQVVQFEITPELMRQIDLAETSPDECALDAVNRIGNRLDGAHIPMYSMFWYLLKSLTTLAQQYNPNLLPLIARVYREAYISHYGEAAMRLGLIKPDEVGINMTPPKPEAPISNGVQADGKINQESGEPPRSNPSSRILGADGNPL